MYQRSIPALLLAIAAQAQTPAPAPRKPIFVNPEQLNMAAILPAPPADDSPRGRAELAEVHRLQDTRTEAMIAHAQADDAEEDMFVFKDVLGEKFTAANLPATALLSAHLHSDEGIIVNPAKTFFAKMRPYNADPTVKPVCKTNVKDYGYPSGHGATGYLEALTLIMMVPEKRDAILERADDYAHSRVVCGVHYSSDGVASKLTAYSMMALIVNNPQFRQEFEAAKAETRRLLGL
jgi:acid phosphatase (class A)